MTLNIYVGVNVVSDYCNEMPQCLSNGWRVPHFSRATFI